ncbi:MAG: hexokinase [Spirochaetales bacterium]|uniref:Hexokinase n=1 Tax=Candidatus Thalassospirochaeta sargassi TaxID=3119039 RepID=A0AAJ1IDM3_9SPIO|nr:hexokinase [Spirochaetales bacterium]
MKEKELDVIEFLDKNHISLDSYNFRENLYLYLKEMEKGLNDTASMPMLPTYIEDSGELPVDEPVLVLDAGGTNFRAALVTFTAQKEPVISRFRKRGMPGFEKELNREEFFGEFADFILELAPEVETIGFCFSYPMSKTADKDGRLLGFSKEIKAAEVVGEMIGRGVLEALEARGVANIRKIVLLNDTIATLLAGKAQMTDDVDGFIGLIYGTGFNACYNEKNINIGKVEGLIPGGSQLINMETGSCSILPSGPLDSRFRDTTARPDAYVLEKMISGGYLGPLWFFVMREASAAGCFSDKFREALDAASKKNMAAACDASDLSRFLSDGVLPEPLEGRGSKQDIEDALILSRAITSRAAYLAALVITAIIIKSGKGRTAEKPIGLCIDGTTFWKLHGLKEDVFKNLEKFAFEEGLYYKVIQIENAPVIGAAVAGLTN